MNGAAPLFSVVVPVFNRAATVLPTLLSVRDQSFVDFECIVVDDGSDDGEQLRAIVEGVGDARFRYVRRPNGGGGAARNTGFDVARGAQVALLDSDDLWLPRKLEQDREAIEDGYVLFSQVIIERGGRRLGLRPRRGPRPNENMSEYLACYQGFTAPSTLCLATDLARRVRFDEQVSFGQDTEFAIRLFAAGATFRMLPPGQVVMRDDAVRARVSQAANWQAVVASLDRLRPLMTERAFHCYRGWHVARLAADASKRRALGFYFSALVKGAFSPALAAKALVQILVPRRVYRKLDRLRLSAVDKRQGSEE